MRLHIEIVVWAMAAAILSPGMARAEDAAPVESSIFESVAATPPAMSSDQLGGIHFNTRPSGLFYTLETRDSTSQSNGFRYAFERQAPPATGIRLAPALSASRTGWAMSGRVGLLKWLTPFDGETPTVMRFGGRIADQPRTPGLGRFNLSVHYAFE
jgi:hypothetical protein